ncbi:hypothetical protein CKO_02884 [Citrobacter koseri ATCC BAA-895]|uniref:Uncharacterized protein n=1 Tax=Citrobacter koseri (strain ATCC BAA-895 / CDC 4225-83 / SGSC4696) TaxID=290338 RepID=A8AKH7_CITK8|nr:hypothetical protein CKO_02884 [Citrobacter koseri ATCC BAA-895]
MVADESCPAEGGLPMPSPLKSGLLPVKLKPQMNIFSFRWRRPF